MLMMNKTSSAGLLLSLLLWRQHSGGVRETHNSFLFMLCSNRHICILLLTNHHRMYGNYMQSSLTKNKALRYPVD